MNLDERKEKKRLYDKEYRRKNRERLNKQKKEWSKKNPDKMEEIRQKNKESKKIKDKEYAIKNKEKLNKIKKEWSKNNQDKVKKANSKYHKNKMKTDSLYKLRHVISSIIRDSLKRSGYSKKYKSVEILGCQIEEFKIHIESKFEPWMKWENYGNPIDGIYEKNKTWDIDHIKPLRCASTEEDIISLNHYTNLQPLCSYFNRFIKRDKTTKETNFSK